MRHSRMLVEIVLALACAIAAFAWAWSHQRSDRFNCVNVVTTDFEAPILWAAGYGFSKPAGYPPALEAFLFGGGSTLDPADLPPDMPVVSAAGEMFVYDRLYLLYAAGLLWKVFGIQWSILPVITASLVAAQAMLLYGIFRLGMGRGISVLGVALTISSPLMVAMFPAIRDVSKAPFILGAILATGYLLTRRVSFPQLLLVAAAVGAWIGIGMGFRQDCTICLPPVLFAVAVLARSERLPLLLRHRFAAAAVCAMAFLLPASPVIWMNLNTGGNNSLYLLQGHAIYCQNTLEMQRASYAPLVQSDDTFIEANVWVHNAWHGDQRVLRSVATRWFWQGAGALARADAIGLLPLAGAVLLDSSATEGISSLDPHFGESGARRLLLHLWRTFPADVLARGYAATIHVARGMNAHGATPVWVNPTVSTRGNPDFREAPPQNWRTALGSHLQRWGDGHLLLAMLIISARSAWMGYVALGIIVYFCGAAGLFFQDRHAYHLEFIAWWLLLFCAARTPGIIAAAWRSFRNRRAPGYGGPDWVASARRGAVFLVLSALTLGTPLVVARAVQHRNVAGIYDTYQSAELTPIPFHAARDTETGHEVWSADISGLHEPVPSSPFARLSGAQANPLEGLLYKYLVAEYEIPAGAGPLTMRVYYDHCDWDNICTLRDDYPLRDNSRPQTVRYYFPVFHFTHQHVWNPWTGFAMEPPATLTNLYMVENTEDFPVPMNLWLFDNPANMRDHQGVPLFHSWI